MAKKSNNQYAERTKNKLEEQQTAAINAVNEAKSFRQRLGGFIMVVKYVWVPLLILWSVLTEGAFLGTETYNLSSSFIIATITTILLIAAIEGSKLLIGKKFIEFFSQGYFQDGWGYYVMAIPIGIWFLIAFGGSATMSIKGPPTISKNLRSWWSPIELMTKDSINTSYDDKVAVYRTDIEAAKQTTWKGKITRGATKIVNGSQIAINELEAARAKDLANIDAANTRLRNEYDKETGRIGGILSGLGGIGELLQFFCLIMFCVYEKIVYEEENDEEEEEEAIQLVTIVEPVAPTPLPAPVAESTPQFLQLTQMVQQLAGKVDTLATMKVTPPLPAAKLPLSAPKKVKKKDKRVKVRGFQSAPKKAKMIPIDRGDTPTNKAAGNRTYSLDNQGDSFESPTDRIADSFSEAEVETIIYQLPIDKLIDRMRNWYKRRENANGVVNTAKYKAGRTRLEKEGYNVLEETDTKLSITQQIEKTK